jgi:hypothetical protein
MRCRSCPRLRVDFFTPTRTAGIDTRAQAAGNLLHAARSSPAGTDELDAAGRRSPGGITSVERGVSAETRGAGPGAGW